VREKKKEDPNWKMKGTKSAPGSSQGNEDGDIFPGEGACSRVQQSTAEQQSRAASL
jgi:hypothetical protein